MPPLEIELDHDRGVPVYRQIIEAVLAALSTGTLARKEQLPTIHELAGRLGINPNTVARAYKELEREGHITAKRGRGTFASGTPSLPEPGDTNAILAEIYERAVAHGARHGISARDILRYFRRSLHERSDK